MPYRVLKEISLRPRENFDVVRHRAGTVLTDSEVDPYVRAKVDEGDLHYCALLELVTDEEAWADREESSCPT